MLRKCFAFTMGLLSLILAEELRAQSITLTAPTTPVSSQEGDEYATNVLGNPWDFNERRDLGWESNYSGSQTAIENGTWRGASSSAGAYVYPLYSGFLDTLLSEGLPGDKNLPRFGFNHPLDASKYKLISFKLNQTSRNTMVIDWNNDSTKGWPDGTNRGARFDGYYHIGAGYGVSGTQSYIFDMSNLSQNFDAGQYHGSWTGSIYTVGLSPAFSAAAGSTTTLDWFRISDPDSAPTLTIAWNSVGIVGLTYPDPIVSVYYDSDNAGYDGVPIKHFSENSDPGTLAVKLAALPPGDYYFYVAAHAPGDETVVHARSAYSAKVTITKAPNLNFISPTQISGEDYSTAVSGNPWDMNDETDIDNIVNPWPSEWKQFSNYSFPSGVFQAVADAPLPQNPHTDVQVHMAIPRVHPIDTKKYRYLTYRVGVDESNYPTLNDKVANGWVCRPIWWWSDLFVNGGRAKAHTLYEGMQTYTMDLWDTSLTEAGYNFKDNDWVAHLRLDPLETTLPTWFYFDYVLLNAEPRSDSSGNFSIDFSIEDSDSSSFNVDLYYDSNNSGFDGTLITSLAGLSAGNNSYIWNTNGFPNESRYYVYAVVSDGTNTRRFYAPVPVVTNQYVPSATPPVAPDPLGRNEITIGTPTMTPRNLSSRGGTVTISVSVTNAVVGIQSVWANITGGAAKIRKKVNLTLTTNNTYVGTWKAGRNRQKNKSKVDPYTITIGAKDNGNATASRRAGRVSVGAIKSGKK